jgi:predicted NUDIX family NTP pyrophosphohydrolase
MPDRVSAGILLFRRSGRRLEVLLIHPGGPFFGRRDRGAWSIPKGEPSADDVDLETVARREFAEEVGLPVPAGRMLPLGEIRQKGGKVVHAWAVEGDLDTAAMSSNTFEMEWPAASGRRASFPEVDRWDWFDLEAARDRVKETQVPLLDRLAEALEGPAGRP